MGHDFFKEGLGIAAQGKGRELALDEGVEALHRGAGSRDHVLVVQVVAKGITSRNGSGLQKRGETTVALLDVINLHVHLTRFVQILVQRNGHDSQNSGVGQLLGAFIEGARLLLVQREMLKKGGGVENGVVTVPEDLSQTLIILGNEGRAGTALATLGLHQGEQIIDGLLRLTPQVTFDGDFHLLETSLEHALDGVRVVGVHGVISIVVVGFGVVLVVTQCVTETLELQLTLVFTTELEALTSGFVVAIFHAGVVFQEVEDGLVDFPEGAEPGVDVPVHLTFGIGLDLFTQQKSTRDQRICWHGLP